MTRWIQVALMALVALIGLHCGIRDTEDKPELSVTPTLLDFGETKTSDFVTISNTGSGTLHWSIEVPSEGWIRVSQRDGNITNEPVAVEVRIDREKAPVGQQQVTLVVTAEQGGHKEITVKATIPDTTPPTVLIEYPAEDAVVDPQVTVRMKSEDNVGVTEVRLYVNGSHQVTLTTAPFEWTWDTLGQEAGPYTLTARAFDAAGNEATSAEVTVRVPDRDAPTVQITAPAEGATVSGNVTVTAEASDNVGVDRVTLYVDGAELGTDQTSPYTWTWNTSDFSNGAHSLTASAWDAAENEGQATAVQVTVSNVEEVRRHLIISNTSAPLGETFQGPILAVRAAGLAGMQLAISFDPEMLRVDTVTSEVFPVIASKADEPGKLEIAAASAEGIAEGDTVVVAEMTFTVVSGSPGSTSPLSFEKTVLFNENTEPMPFSVQNGTFTVEESP